MLALHADMADMVRLGAYRTGTDPAVDEAVALAPRIEAVLRQDRQERCGMDDSFALLRAAVEGERMRQQSMQALLRLRRLTVDAARRDLAACVAEEAAAQEAARSIAMAIARETALACRLDGGDQAVQAFAAWLQQIRPSARASDATVERAVLRAAEARGVLAAARAASEAAETMLARQAAESAAERARAEQRAIDEAAGVVARRNSSRGEEGS